MNYVSEIKIQEVLEEIRFLIEKGILSLEKLKDINADIKKSLFFLGIADGKKVAGSNNIKITLEKMEYSCLLFEIKNISKNKESSFMIDPKCDEISDNLDEIKIRSVLFMEKSAEMIAIYMKQIESQLGEVENNKLSFIDKVKLLPNLIEEDANNNYQILNNTPILKNGNLIISTFNNEISYNGEYLKFINSNGVVIIAPLVKVVNDEESGEEILKPMTEEEKEKYIAISTRYVEEINVKNNQFSDKFIDKAIGSVDEIYLSYIDTTSSNNYVGWHSFKTKDITIDMESGTKNEDAFSFAVRETYTHELGHAFDCSNNEYLEISSSDEWKNIYNQILVNDPNHQYLREYAHSEPEECFAEAINEYYNTPGDLKELEIDIPGYDNLYDYMDNILN